MVAINPAMIKAAGLTFKAATNVGRVAKAVVSVENKTHMMAASKSLFSNAKALYEKNPEAFHDLASFGRAAYKGYKFPDAKPKSKETPHAAGHAAGATAKKLKQLLDARQNKNELKQSSSPEYSQAPTNKPGKNQSLNQFGQWQAKQTDLLNKMLKADNGNLAATIQQIKTQANSEVNPSSVPEQANANQALITDETITLDISDQSPAANETVTIDISDYPQPNKASAPKILPNNQIEWPDSSNEERANS